MDTAAGRENSRPVGPDSSVRIETSTGVSRCGVRVGPSRLQRARLHRESFPSLCSPQDVCDRLRVPLAPACRGDPSGVECFRNLLRVRAPAFWASRMIGNTLAAYLSASAFTASTAFLRAMWSRGLPRYPISFVHELPKSPR